jgi:DNA-3-methyladenine glycosylase I
MLRYHDEEWGVPSHDDRHLFEMLILEGAQAGLSWSTILNKRENYRRAFDGFDFERVARYGEKDIARLLGDAGIVRNRMKIEAAIGNAKALLGVRKEFGSFDAYIWQFVGFGAEEERVPVPEGLACEHSRIGRHEQGPQEARLSLCWLDDLLRVHAGCRDGERPRSDLFPLPGGVSPP